MAPGDFLLHLGQNCVAQPHHLKDWPGPLVFSFSIFHNRGGQGSFLMVTKYKISHFFPKVAKEGQNGLGDELQILNRKVKIDVTGVQ